MNGMTLIEWLRVQLDADEQIASDATPGPWRWGLAPSIKADSALTGTHRVDPRGSLILMTTKGHDIDRADAAFIAAWDPARVLAEVKAKRAILDACGGDHALCGYCGGTRPEHEGWCEQQWLDDMPRLLAQSYADREGWQDEWSVTE